MTSNKIQNIENENPIARDDIHYEKMANDPSIKEFPEGTSYNDFIKNSIISPTTSQFQPDILKSTGGALSEGGKTTLKVDNIFGTWINRYWRPLMGIHYLVACTADFVVFPILWSILQGFQGGVVTSQWMPITLQGGGLYHIALGAILGLSAYGRSQEKIAGKA